MKATFDEADLLAGREKYHKTLTLATYLTDSLHRNRIRSTADHLCGK